MKHLMTTAALAVLAGTLALGGAASAQNYHGGHGDHGSHQGGGWGGDRHDRGDHGGGWGGDRHDHDDRGGGWGRGDRDNRGGGWDHDRGGRDWDRDRGGYGGWHDHSEWRRGGYVSRYDYDRGYGVDYRSYRRLYPPPYGYEWRRVDNNYVLVAIASGLIASIILDGY